MANCIHIILKGNEVTVGCDGLIQWDIICEHLAWHYEIGNSTRSQVNTDHLEWPLESLRQVALKQADEGRRHLHMYDRVCWARPGVDQNRPGLYHLTCERRVWCVGLSGGGRKGGLWFVGTPPTPHLLLPVIHFSQLKKKNEKKRKLCPISPPNAPPLPSSSFPLHLYIWHVLIHFFIIIITFIMLILSLWGYYVIPYFYFSSS